ncbi:Similar to gpn3: GPN-loop GTPase 3 (Xenopus laevis) [Cotesia congregata]|uniref:GPN-loop GTPase 3 n=1 Tax=Cotesia congregata TaxID=51543 RepID=A0A8J2MJD2_COTCN|nr:Similar to gpn3: GPN-loop GTPase 3 (Xenopus laevis) [Cotesia congregata]
MRRGLLVMGSPDSGKSNLCHLIHQLTSERSSEFKVANLDPAAEFCPYSPFMNVRELITLESLMEDGELKMGPNSGLIHCMEYLVKNSAWFIEQLGSDEDDFIVLDLPGQLELSTHL